MHRSRRKKRAKSVRGKPSAIRRSKRAGRLSGTNKKRKGVRLRKSAPSQTSGAGVPTPYDQGYDRGYEEGYKKGIREAPPTRDEAAVAQAYQKGMVDGLYNGGDGLIDKLLPGDMILPELPVIEVIQAGLDQMRPRFHRLLHSAEVREEMIRALDAKTPLSIVRLGDGELLTLAQDTVMPAEQVRREGPFLGYAGVQVPDPEARSQLLQAVRGASLVGIPKLRLPNFQPLAFAVFRAHGLDYHTMRLTDSVINYQLYTDGFLPGILSGRRVLVVGNLAESFAAFLSRHGVQVTGYVAPVKGVKDVPRVMEGIRRAGDFDIALISAGIPAVLLVQQVASELGKVALDFGHLADSMLKGEAPYFI